MPKTPGELDITTMKNLLALVDECSVSRAAARLGTSQSALSHSLAKMRRLFGDPLLIVAHGKMVPTLRALTLQREIGQILASIESLVALDQPFDPSSDRSTIVVSSSELFERLLLPLLHARLREQAPGMRLQFIQPDRTLIDTWLARGTVDFRLAFLPKPETAASLRSRRLFEDSWTCVARAGHPSVAGAISLEQYAALPHVVIDIVGSTTSEQMIDQALGELGLSRHCPLRIQSSQALPHIIATSDSIATLPTRFARCFETLGLQFVEPPIALMPMTCSVYWHERTHRDPSRTWFRQVLADVAAELFPG